MNLIHHIQDTLNRLEKVKTDLEFLEEKKAERIIVMARARWHERGEKSSKYFLNLEKRNHIRKHIRKLNMNGVITQYKKVKKILQKSIQLKDCKP